VLIGAEAASSRLKQQSLLPSRPLLHFDYTSRLKPPHTRAAHAIADCSHLMGQMRAPTLHVFGETCAWLIVCPGCDERVCVLEIFFLFFGRRSEAKSERLVPQSRTGCNRHGKEAPSAFLIPCHHASGR
jgi:hypothetical protein